MIANDTPSNQPPNHLVNLSRWVAGINPCVGLLISALAWAPMDRCGDDNDDDVGDVDDDDCEAADLCRHININFCV